MKKVIGKVILMTLIATISIFLGAKSAFALDLNSFEGLEDIPDNSQTTTQEAPKPAVQNQETSTSTTNTSATTAAEKATQSKTILPKTGSNTWILYSVGVVVLGAGSFRLYKKTKIF